MKDVPNHSQAALWPGELVTIGMLFAIIGESPCSGCETGLPSRPFAFRSATAFAPRFAPLRSHGITTARCRGSP